MIMGSYVSLGCPRPSTGLGNPTGLSGSSKALDVGRSDARDTSDTTAVAIAVWSFGSAPGDAGHFDNSTQYDLIISTAPVAGRVI